MSSVGDEWESKLEGRRYGPAEGASFLARFRASLYIQLILRYAALSPGSRVLEPGCGSGKFSLALASLGHRVIVGDYVANVLRGVRDTEKHVKLKEGWIGAPVAYCRLNLETLPFRDDTFDLILNEGVVEHWLDDGARLGVLREMARVARPGGVVAVLVPNGAHPLARLWEARLEGFHHAPEMTDYSAARLGRELARAGLRRVRADGIYPWRSWVRLPPWDRLYLLAAALDHWVPLSRGLRERWALNLIALGRKPDPAGAD